MKRLFITFLAICAFATVFAQQLTVKTVHLRPQDARARTNPRDDAKGKKCAIIRVGVVGVENLVFPDAIGDVERSLSEYVVYVPEGLKSLKYKTKAGANLGEIIFDDWDMEIQSLASYDVIFESDSHLRSAIFSIQPHNARLVFNGEKVNLNEDGIAMINKPVGEYTYQVSSDGFEGQSGTVSLTEDDISTVTDIVLQEILYPVTINVYPEDATVFIDNVPYSKEARDNLQLPAGKHAIRVTASNYKDEEKSIDVKSGLSPIYYVLKENKVEVIKYKKERTRTSINLRKHWDLLLGSELYNMSSDEKGIDYTLHLFKTSHFAGVLTRRFGFEIGAPYQFQGMGDSDMYYYAGLSLGYGVAFPFGNYNQFIFSSYFSVFGRYRFTDDEALAFGTRISVKLDISHFLIEVNADYSPNYAKVYPGVLIGYKFNI